MTPTLTSRRPAFDLARAALSNGTAVIVSGARGSGRTSFGGAVLAALDEHRRERVWFGDDIEHVDDELATRAWRAVASGQVIPLVTIGRGPLPRALEPLRRRGAISIELPRLGSDDLLRLADFWLGGPLDPDSAAALIPRRGGYDLALLRAWIEGARDSRALVNDDGYWRLTAEHPHGRHLREMIDSRLTLPRAGTGVGPLLELIALAPGLTLGSLDEAVRRLALDIDLPLALEALEDSEVIDVSGAREPRIQLHDGVMELVVSRSLKVLRRRRLSGVVVDVLESLPVTQLNGDELQLFADYSLSLARTPDPELLRRAAIASFRHPDAQLTLRLAAAAVDLVPSFDAELTLAAAESHLGRSRDALERLERLATAATTDVQKEQALRALTTIVAERAGDPDLSLALHQSALSAATPRSDGELYLNASKGFMLYALGDPVGASGLIEPALHVLEGDALSQAYFVIANCALLQGSLARAHETLDAAQAIHESAGTETSTLQLQRAFVLSFEGRLPESLDVLRRFRSAASTFAQWVPQALCTWAIGGLLLSGGRAPEAAIELQSAITLMERVGTARTALLVRTDLARALAVAGDVAGARAALEPATRDRPAVFDLTAKAFQALGWIKASEGRVSDAAADFIRAADAYAQSGHDLAELLSLHESARAGAATAVLDRVEVIASTAEGIPAALALRHVRALAAVERGEASAELALHFADIGREAADITLNLLAAEAHATAAAIHRSMGDARKAAASDRLHAQQLAQCDLAGSPLVPACTSARLSQRETEIATRASTGQLNREIAAQLVLSVRTVETHLQHVYTKLGIRSRSELPDALARQSDADRAARSN
jgi:DNA-binding CsgD family transcriptional regulator/tetratricopeptide (TPR) repeat protein